MLEAILKDYDLINEGGYRWKAEVGSDEVKANLLKKFNKEIGEITDLEITERGASGRAKRLKITGTKGTVEIGKELMIRRLLSPTHLYSSAFNIGKRNAQSTGTEASAKGKTIFEFDGHGWGHGVGLCQIGAARMAIEGYDFRTILSFYYPGSILAH